MKFYPPKINELFEAAKNGGKLENANAVGTGATFVCGAVLQVYLRIDDETKKVLEAKFKTNGCGFLIATADLLAEMIAGKKITELHGLEDDFLKEKIELELGKFENHRKHCLELAIKSLRNAFADFRNRQIEEFTGEKALICTCFGISEETIEKVIAGSSLETVEEVTDICSAGGGCGSCQPLIQEIIDAFRLEEN